VVWAGADNGSIYLWNLLTHRPLQELRSHTDKVRSLCPFTLGDQTGVVSGSGSRDGSLILWNAWNGVDRKLMGEEG
jgi:WD40 repeat protein